MVTKYDSQAERWSEEAYADPSGYLAHRADLIVSLGPPLEAGDRFGGFAAGNLHHVDGDVGGGQPGGDTAGVRLGHGRICDKQRPSAAGRRDAPAERVEEARADDDLIGAVRAGASCRQGDANGGCVGWHGWRGAGQGAGRGAGHRPRPHGRPQRGRFQETLTLSTSAGVTVITRANPVCWRR